MNKNIRVFITKFWALADIENRDLRLVVILQVDAIHVRLNTLSPIKLVLKSNRGSVGRDNSHLSVI